MKYIIALLALVLAPFAMASQDHIVIHGVSKHLAAPDKGLAWQETNLGVGLRRELTNDVSVQAGFYKNSIFKDTFYVSADWAPLKVGPVSVGAFAGLATGYKWTVAPAAGLLMRWQGDRLSVTGRAFPDDRMNGVLSIEFGWRF